ncbi:MAG: hypothetical protein GX263_04030 [Firmicutes bacterium]|nr:hypothetical protein [Bacillota bacterium]
MHRQLWYTVTMSLLLIGIGFFLGEYYAISRGILNKDSRLFCSIADFPVSIADGGGNKQVTGFGSVSTAELQINSTDEHGELRFPSKVGGFYLDKVVSGKEALEHSRRIFGVEVPVENVFIPHYSRRDDQLFIWVFELDSLLEAKKCLDKVNKRIDESDTFEQVKSFFLQNVEVYYVKGLEYNNYYYRKGNIIYWFSSIIDDPIPLFLEFYEYF